MAFAFTVDLDQPIPTRVFRNSGDKAYLAFVGTDDAFPLTYWIMVGLAAGAGCDEFYFKLIEVDAESNEEREYWDGREVGSFVMEADRENLLTVVLRITRLLIETERPECFYYCTHGDNMPPQALEKYERINQLFTECSYQVSLTNSQGGRHSWWAERSY